MLKHILKVTFAQENVLIQRRKHGLVLYPCQANEFHTNYKWDDCVKGVELLLMIFCQWTSAGFATLPSEVRMPGVFRLQSVLLLWWAELYETVALDGSSYRFFCKCVGWFCQAGGRLPCLEHLCFTIQYAWSCSQMLSRSTVFERRHGGSWFLGDSFKPQGHMVSLLPRVVQVDVFKPTTRCHFTLYHFTKVKLLFLSVIQLRALGIDLMLMWLFNVCNLLK